MKADSAPQFYFTLVSIAITPGNEEFAALIAVHLYRVKMYSLALDYLRVLQVQKAEERTK